MKKAMIPILTALLAVCAAVCFAVNAGADGNYVDLTDLTPENVKVGWGELCVNKGLDGQSIDMTNANGGTTVYEHGFTAHADSSLDFDISGMRNVKMFTAFIGAEHSSTNATPSATSISFLVYADGEKLFESGIFGINDPAEEIFVAIPAGTKILTLVTDACGSNSGDHSAWGNPRLMTDASALEALNSIELTTDKNVYLTGSTVQLNAVFTNLGGKTFTPAKVTYSTSDPAVATVSKDGLVTSISAGLVRFTVTATHKGKTLEKTIALTFMDKIEEQSFSIASPSGNLKFDLMLNEEGSIFYTVTDNKDITALERSTIGVNTEYCDFSNALSFVKRMDRCEIDETYYMYSGKKSTVRNHYNESCFVFKKSEYFFDVYVRMYDDGFAYRFGIRRIDGDSETLHIIEETSTFTFPAGSYLAAQYASSLTSSFAYEDGYSSKTVESIGKNAHPCFPATASVYKDGKKTGNYLLLSESDLFGNVYVGSVLEKRDGTTFGLSPAPKISVGSTIEVTTSFSSPWRFGIYGSLGTVVESCMTENLAPASEGDFSWVVPGVTAWMWLSEGFNGQRDEKTIKEYIDMASEMGWKYLILDEGWQPSANTAGKAYKGYFKYFDSLLEYAESKNVGFIVWVKYIDLDTPEEREVLTEWAQKGIKGIKADFFDSEDQKTLEGFKAIYEKCAENHLIVNCHGAGKPTGENRTYPNVINREAVNGEEYGGLWVNGATFWAYTRNVVGPIDITPRLLSTAGNTTTAQMAVNVIFESGIPCMASDSEEYLAFNAKSFYKDLPAAWDDIHFIDGGVGTWVSLARRSGGVWYAATMSNAAKKNLDMPLDFLDDGEYIALIYSDVSRTEVGMSTVRVTNKDLLHYSVLDKGAYIVKFIPASETGKYIPTGITAEDTTVYIGYRQAIEYTLEGENIQITDVVFSSSDPSVVSVTENGELVGRKTGKATVTVASICDGSIKAEFTVKVKNSPAKLASGFEIVNRDEQGNMPSFVLEDTTQVRIAANVGQVGEEAVKNELRYKLPDGDFKCSVLLSEAPGVEGQAYGFVLRVDGKYVAVQRAFTDKNIMEMRTNAGEEAEKDDVRIGSKLYSVEVEIKRSGNEVTVNAGYNVKLPAFSLTFTLDDANAELFADFYATCATEESSEAFIVKKFKVNDEKIAFAEIDEAADDDETDTTAKETAMTSEATVEETTATSRATAETPDRPTEKELDHYYAGGGIILLICYIAAAIVCVALIAGAVVLIVVLVKKKKRKQ